jgi:hypothetical protein
VSHWKSFLVTQVFVDTFDLFTVGSRLLLSMRRQNMKIPVNLLLWRKVIEIKE